MSSNASTLDGHEWVHFSTLVEGMVKHVSYEYTETDCVVTVQLAYV